MSKRQSQRDAESQRETETDTDTQRNRDTQRETQTDKAKRVCERNRDKETERPRHSVRGRGEGRGWEEKCKHVWVKDTVISQARKMRQMASDLQLKRKELSTFIFTWRNNTFKMSVHTPGFRTFGLCGVQDPVRGAPL